MHILEVFIYALIGYLFGGILFSVIVGRIFLKIDIRTIGSNNAGATNLGRAAKGHKGLFLHITGALLDTLKGFVAILINAIIARYGFKTAGFWSWLIYLPMITAALGHCFPPMYVYTLIRTGSFTQAKKYGGGKAVSTFGGSFLSISPIIALILFTTWIVIKKITKITSVASITLGAISPYFILIPMPGLGYLTTDKNIGAIGSTLADGTSTADYFQASSLYLWLIVILIFVAGVIMISRHHQNIVRLINGTENKSQSSKDKKKNVRIVA